jgi:hypothetical protein
MSLGIGPRLFLFVEAVLPSSFEDQNHWLQSCSFDKFDEILSISTLHHLQLGTWNIPATQGPTGFVGRRSWNRQAGSVGEGGRIDAEEEGEAVGGYPS